MLSIGYLPVGSFCLWSKVSAPGCLFGTTASPVCVCYLKLSVTVYLKSVSRLSPHPNINVFVVVVVDLSFF